MDIHKEILIIGRRGQVGWELRRTLAPLGEIVAVDHPDIDLSDPESLRPLVRDVAPDLVVNAAAYTAVDKAEDEVDLVRRINAGAPRVLAEEAARLGAQMVHYSTDYVYDGRKEGRWTESDPTGPLSVYGATKLEGDLAIAATGVQHLIFRLQWVWGTRGGNFVRTMLKLSREREELKIIDDQVGAPTWSRHIARDHCRRRRSLAGPVRRLPSGRRRRDQLARVRPRDLRGRPPPGGTDPEVGGAHPPLPPIPPRPSVR